MTDAKFFGLFSSTDILIAITFSAAVVGLLFLVLPVVIPRLSREMALPFHRRNSLEDTKAALEVQDLRFGWMRTLGTALLTAAVAVGGWAFQQQASRDDRTQREIQSQRDTLARFVGDMDDSSATKRIAAASYLGSALNLWDTPATNAGHEDSDTITRDTLILNALAYRDTVEKDPAVMDFVTASLADAARNTAKRKLVIDAIASQNRRLHREFVSAMHPIEVLLHVAALQHVKVPTPPLRYSESTSLELMSTYYKLVDIADDEANAIFAQRYSLPLYAAVRAARAQEVPFLANESSLHLSLNWSVFEKSEMANLRRLQDLQAMSEQTARTLVAILSNEARKQSAPNPYHINLSYTLIFSHTEPLEIKNASLTGADLSDSVVAVTFRDAQLDLSDLHNSDLGASTLDQNSTLHGDDLTGARLPSNLLSLKDALNKNAFVLVSDWRPVLNGSNWQDARPPLPYELPSLPHGHSFAGRKNSGATYKSINVVSELAKEHDECLRMRVGDLSCPWQLTDRSSFGDESER